MVEAGDQSFAAILRQARRAAGFTQETLAEASGVAARTISDLERGISSAPQGDSGRWLADALGLTGGPRERFIAAIYDQRRVPGPKHLALAPPPVLPNATLGREADIAAIEDLLRRGERIVSLVGVGGIGKTRIASEIADRRAGAYTAWAALAPLSSADQLLPAVARAVGATDLAAAESPQQLAEIIGGKPILLVLDNMEHLLDAAPAISELAAAAPSLSVLVTSREAMRITGERLVPIAPLAVPDAADDLATLAGNPAINLFLRGHAEAAGDQSTGRETLLASAARIVRMVDGMPLAIELAAAQSGTMEPAGIADLLEHSALAVLAAGRRDGPARFRTMEAALAWSADLLPEPALRLLRLLGVFRGGFTTDAAAGVAAESGAPHLVAQLPTLANNYLVRPVSGVLGRYAMLEPVRMFAAAQLEARGELDAARRAHARWYLHWAGRQAHALAGANPRPALDALDADLPNLQAAITSAIRLGAADDALHTLGDLRRFWEYRSHFRIAINLIEDAVDVADASGTSQQPSPALLEAVFSSSYFSTLLGDIANARRTVLRLHGLAAAAGSMEYEVRASVLDANRARYSHDEPELAIPAARAALATAAGVPGGYGHWAALLTLGAQLQESGDPAEALPLLEAAVLLATERGSALDLGVPLSRLGFTLADLGRLDDAERRLAAAAEIAERLGAQDLAVFASLGLARAAALRGDEPGLSRAMLLLGVYMGLLERLTNDPGTYSFSPYWDAANADSRARADALLGPERVKRLIAEGRDLDLPEVFSLLRG